MFSLFKNPKSAVLFVASMVCVCAAAEQLHRDQMTWTVSSIASKELSEDVPAVLDQLSQPGHAVIADYLINDRLAVTAQIERAGEDAFKATVRADSPTLFLRYLGVASLPIEILVEMKKA